MKTKFLLFLLLALIVWTVPVSAQGPGDIGDLYITGWNQGEVYQYDWDEDDGGGWVKGPGDPLIRLSDYGGGHAWGIDWSNDLETLYVAANQGGLYSFSRDGTTLINHNTSRAGNVAVDSTGAVWATDAAGSVIKYSPDLVEEEYISLGVGGNEGLSYNAAENLLFIGSTGNTMTEVSPDDSSVVAQTVFDHSLRQPTLGPDGRLYLGLWGSAGVVPAFSRDGNGGWTHEEDITVGGENIAFVEFLPGAFDGGTLNEGMLLATSYGAPGVMANDGSGEPIIASGSLADLKLLVSKGGDTPGPTPITEMSWRNDASGDATDAASWSPARVPDNEKTIIFGTAISAANTAFVNSSLTARNIQFANSNTYVVGGPGSVNLDQGSSTSNSAIDVFLGDHQFQANVALGNDTNVTIGNGSSLAFNNTLDLGGNTLTKLGGGELAIRNTLVTSGGTIDIQGGTVSGNGTVGGDLLNTGTGIVSPGDGAFGQSVVPEPNTLVLLVLGLLAAVRLRMTADFH